MPSQRYRSHQPMYSLTFPKARSLSTLPPRSAVNAGTLSIRCQSAQSNATTPRMIVPAAWSS